jgi:hypothetical protein
MKKLDERNITRNFLYRINELNLSLDNVCKKCNSIPCLCNERVNLDIDSTNTVDGESFNDLDPDQDGYVTQEDLFGHFDLDNNGIVTTGEYADHITYHTENPESLEQYYEDETATPCVPCERSYNSCKDYYNNDHQILKNCVTDTGATCMDSGIQALIDVLTIIKNSNIL